MADHLPATSLLNEEQVNEHIKSRPIPIKRIALFLFNRYAQFLDAYDLRTKKVEDLIPAVLSRALAAHAASVVGSLDPDQAAACVVDGGQDLGLDAIVLDPATKHLWMVQSKFSLTGMGSISGADFTKFTQGFDKIIGDDFAAANPKVIAMTPEIRAAMTDTGWKISAVLVSTSNQPLSQESVDSFRDYLKLADLGTDTFSFDVLDLAEIMRTIESAVDFKNIVLEIELLSVGFVTDPVYAVYGQIPVASVLDWRSVGPALFQRNVRNFIKDSEVSLSIARTLGNNSELFWYLNNGTTILCDRIERVGPHSLHASHEKARFKCAGVTVVNGAQTVGAIWDHAGNGEELDPRAKLQLRLISLEKAEPGFDQVVTTATNTQKNILPRDFAVHRDEQRRLYRDFQLDGRVYQLREGDPRPDPKLGCTFQEVALALACSTSVELAGIAHRQAGLLTDPNSSFYQAIFCGNTPPAAERVWKLVKVLRTSDRCLLALKLSHPHPKAKQVAAHGLRYLQYRVFTDRQVVIALKRPDATDLEISQTVAKSCARQFNAVYDYIVNRHANDYLQTFFKNAQRVNQMHAALTLIEENTPSRQPSLFDEEFTEHEHPLDGDPFTVYTHLAALDAASESDADYSSEAAEEFEGGEKSPKDAPPQNEA